MCMIVYIHVYDIYTYPYIYMYTCVYMMVVRLIISTLVGIMMDQYILYRPMNCINFTLYCIFCV